jgi:hypothetical protein
LLWSIATSFLDELMEVLGSWRERLMRTGVSLGEGYRSLTGLGLRLEVDLGRESRSREAAIGARSNFLSEGERPSWYSIDWSGRVGWDHQWSQ